MLVHQHTHTHKERGRMSICRTHTLQSAAQKACMPAEDPALKKSSTKNGTRGKKTKQMKAAREPGSKNKD